MEEEASLFGLGFSASASGENNHVVGDGATSITTTTTPSTAANQADVLMKHYLQQCIVYHHDHELQTHQDQSETSHNNNNNNVNSNATTETPIQFVAAQQQEQHHLASVNQQQQDPLPSQLLPPIQSQESFPVHTVTASSSTTEITDSTYQAAQQAMAKARDIIRKFQMQQQNQISVNCNLGVVDNTIGLTPPGAATASSSSIITTPMVYRKQREDFFIKEQERFHKAMLKNFEYVAKKEEERYERQLQQIQQTKYMEQQLTQHHSNILQQRQHIQQQQQTKNNKGQQAQHFSSRAGIGTARRHQLESVKQQKGHAVKKQQHQQQQQRGIAIYVSGLPTDGSIQQLHLQQLFSSYGPIQKIHLYRNKTTNQIKGDALVVYETSGDDDEKDKKHILLDTVCSQMTGAELSCGSILKVEPADSEYKSKQKKSMIGTANAPKLSTPKQQSTKTVNVGYYGPSSSSTEAELEEGEVSNDHDNNNMNSDGKKEDDKAVEPDNNDEDLDDFFASL